MARERSSRHEWLASEAGGGYARAVDGRRPSVVPSEEAEQFGLEAKAPYGVAALFGF